MVPSGAAWVVVFDCHDCNKNTNQVIFRGIGLTCTEYMMKPHMDDRSYPGSWAYHYCFGGPPSNGTASVLNKEPQNVLKYLQPDTQGGSYPTQPQISKVKFGDSWFSSSKV